MCMCVVSCYIVVVRCVVFYSDALCVYGVVCVLCCSRMWVCIACVCVAMCVDCVVFHVYLV